MNKQASMENNTSSKNVTRNGGIWLFFALALILGGVGYLPSVLNSYGMGLESIAIIFSYLGGASPAIAAVVVARKVFGKSGPDYLFFSVWPTSTEDINSLDYRRTSSCD